MKIQVRDTIRDDEWLFFTVRVYDCDDIAAAIEAIEFVHDAGEVVYSDAYEKVLAERDELRQRIVNADRIIAGQVATIDRLEAENMRQVASLVEFRRRLDNILRMARGV